MERVRQKLALVLVMVLFITQGIPVMAQVKPLIIKQNQVIQLENGEAVDISLEINNTSQTMQTAYMIIALYHTTTNEMVAYDYTVETLEKKQTRVWNHSITVPQTGQYKMKIFAWDQMDNPTLLSNVIEVTQDETDESGYEAVLNATSAYLATQTPQVMQTVGGEWSVFGLARSGYPVPSQYYEDYIQRVEARVLEEVADTSRPFSRKVTETQRLAIALTAVGEDAQTISEGVDLLDYTWNKEGNFPMLGAPQNTLGGMQGISELVYGLIAIDLLQYTQPDDATITREEIINQIIQHQKLDGGFGLSKQDQASGVDVTAMAIQALAPYTKSHTDVNTSVDKALAYLSAQQSETGGFVADTVHGAETSESTAQVLVALSTLGIDATQDSRFIKGENNPLSNLLSYYAGDGMFKHTLEGPANMMGTEQSHYALVAYDRLLNGKNTIYDMSDVTINDDQPNDGSNGDTDNGSDEIPNQEGSMIEVAIQVDRSSIATNEVLAQMGHNQKLEETIQIEVEKGSTVLDVLHALELQEGIVINVEGNFLQGIDKIYGAYTEEFELLCEAFGLEIVPQLLMSSGWLYEINGTEAFIGIDEQVVENQDTLAFRMALYWGQDETGNWVKHDWNFIDAYKALEVLSATVDLEGYSGVQKQEVEEALTKATTLLQAIDEEAQGKWLTYIGTKLEALHGEDSPTQQLIDAYEALIQAMEDVLVPIGEVAFAIEKRTIGKGDTLTQTTYPLYEADTAWDVIERAMIEEGIDYEIAGSKENQNIYIAAVDGDSEFDYGSGSGWKYQVNNDFPAVSVVQQTLQPNDFIRLRYTTTVSGAELEKPLVELLELYVEDARAYHEAIYTQETYKRLQEVIQLAETMITNPIYATQETAIELEVSAVIGKIMEAIDGLQETEDHVTAPSEIPDDFINDISLNKDFHKMNVGATYQIVARRLEEIVDNPIENTITHPNYKYEVISGDSIVVDQQGQVTANKIGTSIVAVTYDEMTINSKVYGEISDTNTGLFVVDVTDPIDTGITITLTNEENHVVPETRSYDTYYFQEDYFEYDFSVDVTNADEVEVFVNGTLIEAEKGIYTAQLENKGNIIKVVAKNNQGTETFAQVIDARKVEVNVRNITDPTRNDDIQEGDKVSVSFRGITLPVHKLATIYNPSFDSEGYGLGDTAGAKVAYTSEKTGEVIFGKATQWDLAKDNAIEFVAEEVGTYHFTGGHIDEGWWGSVLGTEKTMNGPFPEGGLGADHHNDQFSYLPDFSITVSEKPVVPVEHIEIINTPGSLEFISDPDLSQMTDGQYQLEVRITPSNATVESLLWHTADEAVLAVDHQGKITAKGVGSTIITVQVEGSENQAHCEVTVIPELPATQEERSNLKSMIDQVQGLEAVDYTTDSWNVFYAARVEAERIYTTESSLLKEVRTIENTLQKATQALITNPTIGITTPQGITIGSEVTIYLPNLQAPKYEGFPVSKTIKTVFETDIPGLETLSTKNAFVGYNIDSEILRTIQFVMATDVLPGKYTLTNGRIEASSFHPQFNRWDFQTYYKGIMPELTIIVEE